LTNTCTIKDETCGFKCTAFEGADVWKKRMDITKKIECDVCRDHAVKNEKGIHDHVSVGLGKKPFDKNNYTNFVKEVNCVFDTCKKSGRC